MSLIMIIFLVFAIVVCFYAYREFKAIFYEHVGLGQGMVPNFAGGLGGGGRPQPNQQRNQQSSI
eukprot:CAMPEP_0170541830 /NCGR_PEP_ID=MMETSP0211-20121228/1450_1 /TAXON_ID=311385 /ORGANISM="Pseudokeronopsis sp., Strain OXSARD2" /LENGTH=63 /DNA_ID=CAMNT_0010844699 /DNA_START=369 /DNA_END=560 /DNA_ORIENTATION=+